MGIEKILKCSFDKSIDELYGTKTIFNEVKVTFEPVECYSKRIMNYFGTFTNKIFLILCVIAINMRVKKVKNFFLRFDHFIDFFFKKYSDDQVIKRKVYTNIKVKSNKILCFILFLFSIQAVFCTKGLYSASKYDPLAKNSTTGYFQNHNVPTEVDLFGDISVVSFNMFTEEIKDTDVQAVVDLINNTHPTILSLQGVRKPTLDDISRRLRVFGHYGIVNYENGSRDAITGDMIYLPIIYDSRIVKIKKSDYITTSGKKQSLYASYALITDERLSGDSEKKGDDILGADVSYVVVNADLYSSFPEMVSAMFFNIISDIADAKLNTKPIFFTGNMGITPDLVKDMMKISYKNLIDVDSNNKTLMKTTDHTNGNDDNIQRDFILLRDVSYEDGIGMKLSKGKEEKALEPVFKLNYARILNKFTSMNRYPVHAILSLKQALDKKEDDLIKQNRADEAKKEAEIAKRLKDRKEDIENGDITPEEIAEEVADEISQQADARKEEEEEKEAEKEKEKEEEAQKEEEETKERLEKLGLSADEAEKMIKVSSDPESSKENKNDGPNDKQGDDLKSKNVDNNNGNDKSNGKKDDESGVESNINGDISSKDDIGSENVKNGKDTDIEDDNKNEENSEKSKKSGKNEKDNGEDGKDSEKENEDNSSNVSSEKDKENDPNDVKDGQNKKRNSTGDIDNKNNKSPSKIGKNGKGKVKKNFDDDGDEKDKDTQIDKKKEKNTDNGNNGKDKEKINEEDTKNGKNSDKDNGNKGDENDDEKAQGKTEKMLTIKMKRKTQRKM
ncbi:hypothetical protein EDEG_03031 [Edhazardia aedis USNM 41457]|uniref:Endonuclease/exonuclease/phosphatase domain-containing protein n=1 Tax=Edhazardia aedis (strain USNM 41457) TaxID=1003232 RepID=J8ZSE8_EDHAE|nr:hypothetical protein EDEG_03031 [Edhazardia aedis USNM 41457]|eukprot:EJW02563.1 hypothetical protein EDEG_03031 [Edhazardia aedis USNM 41457]